MNQVLSAIGGARAMQRFAVFGDVRGRLGKSISSGDLLKNLITS